MSNYPAQDLLAQKLKLECNDTQLCNAIASEFANKKISCSHRVAQRGAFEVGSKLKSSDNDVASCAKTLCGFVDQTQCSM